MLKETFKIGVDIGGTFTDVTIVEASGRITSHKTPSTPQAPAEAVLQGINEAVALAQLDPASCASFVHGSTVGVNTIIQRLGARVGVLVTAGFEDLLELGRAKMPDPFSLFTMRPIPLSRRNWVRGVKERIDAKGRVVTPLDEEALLLAATELSSNEAASLAIVFINAYRNPEHEERGRDLVRKHLPHLDVVISTEIWPQIREYERATVAVMNSYIAPKVKNYLAHLQSEQKTSGLHCPLYMTSSNGGIVPISHAMAKPITTLLSGPASGIVAALQLMQASGLSKAITMDIGGTSADLCVLDGEQVPYAWDQEIAGLPVTLPSVDISSIGAGGGSIAYSDNLGLLRVGPQSAGADPGPVAYGRGGAEPTLTDAYLVSGFIDPDKFLGGRLRLDFERARRAIERLSVSLKLNSRETARGIVQVATSNLAAEVTRLAAKKGIDVREFVLIPFGGAGATHACLLADEMNVEHIAIPYSPGTFCAAGSVMADFRLDYLKMIYSSMDKINEEDLESWFHETEAIGRTALLEAASDIEQTFTLRSAGARYRGQGYEVNVPFSELHEIPAKFQEEYGKLYGPRTDEVPLEVISVRATVVGVTRKTTPAWAGEINADPARGTRRIDVAEQQIECPVFARAAMAPGWRHTGPFVVDQPDTTSLVTLGWSAEVDSFGTLHLKKEF